jgi:integrase
MSGKRDYGDGGIDQRGPDHWRLRWRVDGKRYSKSFHGTKRAAQAEIRRLLKIADDRQHVAPDKTTLASWIDQWLALLQRREAEAAANQHAFANRTSHRSGKRTRGLVNAKTLERYAELLRLHVRPTLGSRRLQQITAPEIDALYVKLEAKLSSSTVHAVHVVLGSCLNAAVRKGLLISNPVRKAEAPAAGDNGAAGQVLDQDGLGRLLDGFRGRAVYPIVATAAFTGARRGELLALQWSDFDPLTKALTFRRSLEETKEHGLRFKEPKTERGVRTIAIDDYLVALLCEERDRHRRILAGIGEDEVVDLSLVKLPDGALIFPSAAGKRVDLTRPRHPEAVTKNFAQRATKLGFPEFRFHDLRGTHETMLLDAGVPVHVVAARCGHDPAVLLKVYAKRTRKADTSAAAVIGTISRNVLG